MIIGKINGYKTNHHPKEFFSDELTDSNGHKIVGNTYLKDYEFLPTKDLKAPIWDQWKDFICARRNLMVEFLESRYKLTLKQRV